MGPSSITTIDSTSSYIIYLRMECHFFTHVRSPYACNACYMNMNTTAFSLRKCHTQTLSAALHNTIYNSINRKRHSMDCLLAGQRVDRINYYRASFSMCILDMHLSSCICSCWLEHRKWLYCGTMLLTSDGNCSLFIFVALFRALAHTGSSVQFVIEYQHGYRYSIDSNCIMGRYIGLQYCVKLIQLFERVSMLPWKSRTM